MELILVIPKSKKMHYFYASLTKKFSSSLFKVILGQKVGKSSEYCKLKDSGLQRDQPV